MESESSGCSGWLTEFTNLPFVDFASVECHSIRNDRCLLSEVWHHKQFGSEDKLVYNSTENTHELDDSSIENLFESDPESEFEGFIV